jgi:hypothetical protein
MTDVAALQLRYTEDELMRDHEHTSPHVVNGRLLHGGILAHGTYQPPRALVREQTLAAWEAALRARGGTPLDADASLLNGDRVPSVEQGRVLLRHGLGETFWNSLTITGKIEAKGRLLAEIEFPDLQQFVVEDISNMAIGHLNGGLLKVHGVDEGGWPGQAADALGAHDVMWFVARDLAFGEGAYPDVEPPENIARPESGRRWMPEVSQAVEGIVSFLMNLLVIEFRAEIGFAAAQAILRTPDLFPQRREQAELGAEIIGRIRADEEIHVRSLRLYLGELASVTFRTVDGGTIAGRELIDRYWADLVTWATVEQPPMMAQQQRATIEQRVRATARDAAHAGQVLAEFGAAAGRD